MIDVHKCMYRVEGREVRERMVGGEGRRKGKEERSGRDGQMCILPNSAACLKASQQSKAIQKREREREEIFNR